MRARCFPIFDRFAVKRIELIQKFVEKMVDCLLDESRPDTFDHGIGSLDGDTRNSRLVRDFLVEDNAGIGDDLRAFCSRAESFPKC